MYKRLLAFVVRRLVASITELRCEGTGLPAGLVHVCVHLFVDTYFDAHSTYTYLGMLEGCMFVCMRVWMCKHNFQMLTVDCRCVSSSMGPFFQPENNDTMFQVGTCYHLPHFLDMCSGTFKVNLQSLAELPN